LRHRVEVRRPGGRPEALKAFVMTVQDLPLFSLASSRGGPPMPFADPEWRGGGDEWTAECRLRPLSEIGGQLARLGAWIAAGGDYGWLGAYQARRAAFELQSIRAQIEHGRMVSGALPDTDRRAVQSRLDRLEACLNLARAEAA
jgi:hypothetical protein